MNVSPTSLTLQIKQTEMALRHRLGPELTMAGVSFEQWQVLAALLIQPGQGMTELAESASLAPASLTRHVDKLVELALVVRRVDPNDKRRIAVALSTRGAGMAERIHAAELGLMTSVAVAG